MISLPDYTKKYDYENGFYLTCDSSRVGKLLAHYELLKQVVNLPGDIAEFGVFKGASFVRFAMMRELLGLKFSKKLIGFDTFGSFPDTEFSPDVKNREKFVQGAGDQSISIQQLKDILEQKKLYEGIELISGDILKTLPEYINENPHIKFSLINLDTDLYEPAVCILNHCWNRLISGGILILDDYGYFAGENKAVDDFFQSQDVKINCFSYVKSPSYIIKR